MDIGKIFKDAIEIVKNPKGSFDAAVKKPMNQNEFLSFVGVLAVWSGIGSMIGGFLSMSMYAAFMPAGYGSAIITATMVAAVMGIIMAIVGAFVMSIVINTLATNFKSTQSKEKSQTLVAYALAPGLLAGILNVIPGAGGFLVLIAGLYGLYILYLGLPVMMDTPKDQVTVYFVVSLVVMIVIQLIIAAIVGGIIAAMTISAAMSQYVGAGAVQGMGGSGFYG